MSGEEEGEGWQIRTRGTLSKDKAQTRIRTKMHTCKRSNASGLRPDQQWHVRLLVPAGTLRACFHWQREPQASFLAPPPLDQGHCPPSHPPRLTPMPTHKLYTSQMRLVVVGWLKGDKAAWMAPPKSWVGGRQASPFFFPCLLRARHALVHTLTKNRQALPGQAAAQ